MKSRVIIAAVCAVLFCALSAIANDPPHNDASGVPCGECHGGVLFCTDPDTVDPEDLRLMYDDVCLRCHDSTDTPYHACNAPLAGAHQSVRCIDCHHPHYQTQQLWYGRKYYQSEYEIAHGEGSVTDTETIPVVGLLTEISFTSITFKSDWSLSDLEAKTSDGRGMLFLPNRNSPYNSRMIYEVTDGGGGTGTIKVKGSVSSIASAGFVIAYGQAVKREIPYASASSEPVMIFDQKGEFGFAHNDGQAGGDDSTPNGICQVCHTETDHWRRDGTMTENHYSGEYCIRCHPHTNGFLHGGGSGTGCEECHGHDAGYGGVTGGAGTFASHSTHTENDSDDVKGPNIDCEACHDTNNFPYFNSGTDANGDELITLDETDVCDICHSPGGTYDGVDNEEIGAKPIWSTGAYVATDDSTLRSGKEKWCATCHDESPSQIQSVDAPNVVGDEDATVAEDYVYGNISAGWGFYKTGHGLDSSQSYPASGGIFRGAGKGCADCHDFSSKHIDGKVRSFDCTNSEDGEGIYCDADEYREDYRLVVVNGRNPMEIPLANNIAPNANNYMLCFSNNGCHLPDKYLTKSTAMETMFRDDTDPDVYPLHVVGSPPLNAHEYHLNFKAGMYSSRMAVDWRSFPASNISCTACHNVHGSTQLAMVRDGRLVDNTMPSGKGEPGLKILYTNIDAGGADSDPTPANRTLAQSTGTFWDADTPENLCSDCHGNNSYSAGLIYRRNSTPVAQQAPTLDWTEETGYGSDGSDPDSGEPGAVFLFRVKFSDANHDLPTVIQVWLDLDGDGYETHEKHDLWEADFDDHDTVDGKIYRKLIKVNVATGSYNYRFYARDRHADATGAPVTSGGTVSINAVANQAPILTWTGDTGYESDGVDPDIDYETGPFVFRVTYADGDSDAPSVKQIWIDLNDDGDFDDASEKQDMSVEGAIDYLNGTDFQKSISISYAGYGILNYTFHFEDASDVAVGEPTALSTVIVRESCDLTVCETCSYTSIQAAVTASANGDIVCVDDGTWDTFAFNNKDITVQSINGPASTIIDGGGSGNTVDFNWSDSDATLKGFTIRNGNKGISIIGSKAVILDCIIEDNITGGIYVSNDGTDPIVLEDVVIRNNGGPGIHNTNSGFVATVSDAVFSGNTAGSGGGIYAQNGAGTYTFERCAFIGNEATGNGGAVRLGRGIYTFTNCIFSGNYAGGNGGGVFATDPAAGGSIIFMNSTFAGNSAELGGGIYSTIATTAYMKVHNSILWGNTARSSDNDEIDGALIDDPGSIYRTEVKYTDIGLSQRYSVFSNQVGNMYLDPLFFYPISAASAPSTLGDYHLTETSPVIDQALTASPPGVDIEGQVRPNPDSDGIDMGADEYYSYAVDYNATAAGTATAVAAGVTTINISMPYGNDYNGDNTYTIEYKLNSSGIWLDWGTNPKAHTASPYTDTITGLTAGEAYDVRLIYHDSDGVSGTNPQTFNVDLPDNKTTAGTGTAMMADLMSIDVSMPYTDDYNGNNTYTVEYKLSSDGSWTPWATGAVHTASPYTDTITGLTSYETYDVRLSYNDADGVIGTNPQVISGIDLAYNETATGSATAAKASDTSIDISMPYTDDDNGDNTYTVDYKLSSDGSWTNWVTEAAHTLSPYMDTITGLASGNYDVRMTYNDADGVNGTNPQTVTGIELASVSCNINVCGSGGGDHTTIQAGINAAVAGQTVCVCAGTYSENIDFLGKNITVIAVSGSGSTIIQGGPFWTNDAVVSFENGENSNAALDGFTINNQYENSLTRGIFISSATPTIKNCVITGNHSRYGAGSGGGVYTTGTGGGTFYNTAISSNTTGADGELAGGIYHTGSGTLTITGGSVESNYAYKGGGGIYVTGGSLTINGGATVKLNSSGSGGSGGAGGIHYAGSGTLTITDSTVESNTTSKSAGGGLYLISADAVISGTTFKSNTNSGDLGGGGIYMGGTSPSLSLSNSYIIGNMASSTNNLADGGGINISAGTATITNTVIAGNITAAAQGDGGGICNTGILNLYFSTVADNYAARNGDGLQADGTETVRNSIIWGNTGENIGGTVDTDDNNETTTDPVFLKRSPAESGSPTIDGDYHLCNGVGDPDALCTGAESSPCIDTGNDNNAPADDIDGGSRPVNSLYDKGADEYGSP